VSLPPYLKNKTRKLEGFGQVIHRESDDKEQEDRDAPMHAAAEDMIRAIQSGDSRALARALKDAFDILESAPHEEYQESEEDEGDSE